MTEKQVTMLKNKIKKMIDQLKVLEKKVNSALTAKPKKKSKAK